ncbi:MAG: universal stress protein [Anaerolineales bacterium]|nr:universal stress protein [Anaerolineales bacterium]
MKNRSKRRKITAALDGSDPSRLAAELAVQIAQKQFQKIEAYYIVDEALILDPYSDHGSELGWELEDSSSDYLLDSFREKGTMELDWFQQYSREHNVETATNLLLGGVPELILRYSRNASFLALGRRGNSHAPQKDHLGKHFLQIAHHAGIPLMIGGDESRPLNKVMLLLENIRHCDQAVEWAGFFHEN